MSDLITTKCHKPECDGEVSGSYYYDPGCRYTANGDGWPADEGIEDMEQTCKCEYSDADWEVAWANLVVEARNSESEPEPDEDEGEDIDWVAPTEDELDGL